MTALAEARLFAQQLHQQQQQQQLQQQQYQQLGNNSLTQSGLQLIYNNSNNNNNNNNYSYAGSNNGDSRRSSMTGARSTAGSVMSGRLSALGGGVGGGTSPVLGGGVVHFSGGDEPAEQTLLLARPYWVPDQDAAACRICAKGFNAVRRKHHCRQCGHVLCYDCCSRSIALPQLGYTKAVRVCNDCFEVAYLVAYCLSDDLGPSTQIHGARGIYELIEANDEKALDSVLDHGGLDAMIYLCSMVHGYELHSLATSALAALAEHHSIQSVIVSKRAMPKLFYLVATYAQHIVTSPLRPPSPPMTLTRMASTASLHTKSVRRIETVAVVLMNITHIVFQLIPDSKSFAHVFSCLV
ncbi:MAG: FYVE zinc finger-domain-containing protein [Linnemannia elongata]|nr:MAG: FYVE zinc finger-domain-containing protein [Linnemannia elongata]